VRKASVLSTWPQTLRIVVDLVLASGMPMAILWGTAVEEIST
jgi:hypothetical protein